MKCDGPPGPYLWTEASFETTMHVSMFFSKRFLHPARRVYFCSSTKDLSGNKHAYVVKAK